MWDEQAKKEGLDKKLAAAAAKGLDTTQTAALIASCTSLIADYERILAAAVAAAVGGVDKLKKSVDDHVTLALARLAASMAKLARKTAKAGVDGIVEAGARRMGRRGGRGGDGGALYMLTLLP